MTKSKSKLASYATTTIFVVGLTIVCYVLSRVQNETLSMLSAVAGSFYFLSYGKIEAFVVRLSETKG